MSEMSPCIFYTFLNWVECRINLLLWTKNAPHLNVISDEYKYKARIKL